MNRLSLGSFAFVVSCGRAKFRRFVSKIDLHWSTDHPTPLRVEKQSSEAQVAH